MPDSDFNPSRQHTSMESKIIAAMERISQAFRVLLWEKSVGNALTPIQIQVLIFLLYHDAEKRKISYLAGEFHLAKPTVSQTVKILEQKGLIRKEYGQGDSRSYVIHLTPAGEDVARRTADFTREMRAPLEQLAPDQKTALLGQLTGMIHHLHKARVITLQRMCLTCAHYRAEYQGHAHYCRLLNEGLDADDLRIDCPEHRSVRPLESPD